MVAAGGRWRRSSRAAALVLAAGLVLAACGDGAEDPVEDSDTPEDEAAPDGDAEAPDEEATEDGARQGGDLVFARTRDNAGMDPVEAVETDTIYVLDHIFETLFATSDDGSEVVPKLASGVEISDDALTYTVALRDDVTFSNGEPMTSEDVRWSVERALNDSPFGFLLSAIDTIDTPDEGTVVFNLQFPWAPFLADLSLWAAGIMPAEFGGMEPEEFFENPIGTGPFTLDEWNPGESIRLVRNPNYWQEGKPYLDSVTWTLVPDENTRMLQLEGEQADIISEVPLSQMDALNSKDGIVADSFELATVFWLSFNTTEPPFDDIHLRRAIAHAIDKEAIADAVLFGFGGPACSVISPVVPFHDPDTPCLEHDLELAADELAQSAYPDGVTVEYLVGDQTPDRPIAEIIQNQLAPLGIDVELRPIDFGQFYSTVFEFDYQMAYTGWTMDIPDPDQKIAFMFDPELGGGDSYSTGYENPEMIELVRAGQQAVDLDERAEIYAQIQALAAEESPFIPLVVLDNAFAWREDVRGLYINPVGKRNLENVWLER